MSRKSIKKGREQRHLSLRSCGTCRIWKENMSELITKPTSQTYKHIGIMLSLTIVIGCESIAVGKRVECQIISDSTSDATTSLELCSYWAYGSIRNQEQEGNGDLASQTERTPVCLVRCCNCDKSGVRAITTKYFQLAADHRSKTPKTTYIVLSSARL